MTNVTTNFKEVLKENIEANKERYLTTSHKIHANPEIGNEEFLLLVYLHKFLKMKDL